jgi:hypothetical protein
MRSRMDRKRNSPRRTLQTHQNRISMRSRMDRKRNSPRRTLQTHQNRIGMRSRMDRRRNLTTTSLGTSQGISILKIVLLYSVLGIVLNWVLPILILEAQPGMLEKDAQYYGVLGAIIITFFFLVVSLIKGIILRHRSQQEHSESHRPNNQLFTPNNTDQNRKNRWKINNL